MSVAIKPLQPTDSEDNYRIEKKPKWFTDWNGGDVVANKPENRRDDVLLHRPTMDMGNRTLIGSRRVGECDADPPLYSYLWGKRDLYTRLQSHNRDQLWQHREDVDTSSAVDNQFRKDVILGVAHQVELLRPQRYRAFRRFMSIDFSRWTGTLSVNALVICAIVANEDSEARGEDKQYHPQRPAEKNDEHFQRLHDTLVTDRKEVSSEDPVAHLNKWADEELIEPPVDTAEITKVYNKHKQCDPPNRPKQRWKPFVQKELEPATSSSDRPDAKAVIDPTDDGSEGDPPT